MKCDHCGKELSPRDDTLTEVPDDDGGKAYHFMCTPVAAIEGLFADGDGDCLGALLRKMAPGWQEGQMPALAQTVADRIAERLSDAFNLADGGRLPVSLTELDFDGVFQAVGCAVGPEVSAALSKADAVRWRPDSAHERWPTIEAHRDLEQRVTDAESEVERMKMSLPGGKLPPMSQLGRHLDALEEKIKHAVSASGVGKDISNCESRLDGLEGALREDKL